MLEASVRAEINKIFYFSSAYMYLEYNQMDPDILECLEESSYLAEPESEYG